MVTGTAWIKAERFEGVAEAGLSACATADGVYGLVLAHDLPFAATSSEFVRVRTADAEEWLKTSSDINHLTHGAYFLGDRGLDYVVSELERKPGSRRALLSLVCMEDLLGSGDEPIPSFMILQFAIDGSTLYATAYFRALEVSQHLPVNLAEIALQCRRIQSGDGIGPLERLRLMIVAFRAYANWDTSMHRRAEVDRLNQVDVAFAVHRREIARVKEWLLGKRLQDSRFETCGLQTIRDAAERTGPPYSPLFVAELDAALQAQRDLREVRRRRSEGTVVDDTWQRTVRHLEQALAALPEE